MVSVIIPTYNNELTIERALFSVLTQLYIDWEIVVVNDASTDNTKKIVEHYCELYPGRIRMITNKKNQGVGIGRQLGLKEAKGEFITFLDSDDFLVSDFLYNSMMLQAQHDSDVVYSSYVILWPEGVSTTIPAGDFIMEGEATSQLHFIQEKKFLTGKIFRKSLLEKIPWSDRRVGEDVQTLFFATYMADKVRSTSYAGYVHCFRQGSLLADAEMFFTLCESMTAQQEILEFLLEKDDQKTLEHELRLYKNAYDDIKKAIDAGEIPPKTLKENRKTYKRMCKWYEAHKELIDNLPDEQTE